VAVKVADKSADTVTKVTIMAMKNLPPEKVKTMTFDNGKEFAGFKELEQGLNIRSYFARPYHSWERGTNENTNGLLRQFFLKGMDFEKVMQSNVDIALELLNNRPRKFKLSDHGRGLLEHAHVLCFRLKFVKLDRKRKRCV
jgi:IS30 family transposase